MSPPGLQIPPFSRLAFLSLEVIQHVCGSLVFVSDSISVPGAIISTSLIALQAKYLSGLESKEWASPGADSQHIPGKPPNLLQAMQMPASPRSAP